MAIINSIFDNDLYKFTQQQAVVKLFPKAKVKYSFINRDNREFPDGFAEKLRKEVKSLEKLSLSKDEKKYLENNCLFLDPTYITFLSGYRFDSTEVGIIQKGKILDISIEGYWHKIILWEVPLMAIISELYFKETNNKINSKRERSENNLKKASFFRFNGLLYADLGTRRRYSYDIHEELINCFTEYNKYGKQFVGTSNVHFAHKYGIKCIGTQAHEWYMFHAAKYGFKIANQIAMEHWIDVYRGNLGIALSDTFTSKSFFNSFDTKFAKLYDGIRHDSGDPIIFAKNAIDHYKKLGIDPLSKTIIFSDSLNPEKAEEIASFCRSKIKCSFGIGTNFTNDVGVKPLNIVIKMVEAKPDGDEWIETIKLSDNEGKHLGSEKMLNIAKTILNI